MPWRFRERPAARGTAPCFLVLAACCAAPAASVRLHGQQPRPALEFLFFPTEEKPDAPRSPRGAAKGPRRESPPTRQLIWDPSLWSVTPEGFTIRYQQGFDNVLAHLYLFMGVAMVADARLVVPHPHEVLSMRHVGSLSDVPEWWDGYFDAEPRLYRDTTVPQSADCRRWNTTRVKAEIALGKASPLLDPSRSLCVRWVGPWRDGDGELLGIAKWSAIAAGTAQPRLYASSGMVELVGRVLQDIGPAFGSAHVRQYDKGTPPCVSAENVVAQMLSSGPDLRWFVASNGNSTWFHRLRNLTEGRVNVTTEHELPSLTSLKDNYMRYAVEKCVFGVSEKRIDTYWDVASFNIAGASADPTAGERSLRLLCEVP